MAQKESNHSPSNGRKRHKRSQSNISNPHKNQGSEIRTLLAYIDSVVDAQEQNKPIPHQPSLDIHHSLRKRSRSISSHSPIFRQHISNEISITKSSPQIVTNHNHLHHRHNDINPVANTSNDDTPISNGADMHLSAPNLNRLYMNEWSATPNASDTPRSVSSSSLDFDDRDSYQLMVSKFLTERGEEEEQKYNNQQRGFRRFQYPSSIEQELDNDAQINSHTIALKTNHRQEYRPKFNNKLSTVLSIGHLENEQSQHQYSNEEILTHETKAHFDDDTHDNLERIIDPRSHEECKRLMFLYNSKSGGQKALILLKYLKGYTNLLYDLFTLNSSPQELQKLANHLLLYQDKIVVCAVGGDGSQAWASSLIDRALKTAASKNIKFPTIVPFPVGTGNDLSRSLGWGNVERTPDKIIKHVADVHYCFNISKRFSVLDRWGIQYIFPHIQKEWSMQQQNGEDVDIEEGIDKQSGEELKEHDGGDEEEEVVEVIEKKKRFESEEEMLDDYINSTFNPPLPKQFLCYLSFGYDAMITYNFQMERKHHPEKFKSQLSNQSVYLRMGFQEFMSPSTPVNDSVALEIDGKPTAIPKNTRSLKLVNINSAANGIFFWGYKKSRKEELQEWKRPQLCDGLIEVMATKGTGDLAMAATHLSHAHRLGQTNNIKLTVIKAPVYLQIDGEAWMIEKECTLNIKLYDQLPTLIGYKFPRGVYHKYEADYYTDEMKKARHRYRKTIRMKYGIPKRLPKDYDPEKPMLKTQKSRDDFHLNIKSHDHENHDEKTDYMERTGKLKIFSKHPQSHSCDDGSLYNAARSVSENAISDNDKVNKLPKVDEMDDDQEMDMDDVDEEDDENDDDEQQERNKNKEEHIGNGKKKKNKWKPLFLYTDWKRNGQKANNKKTEKKSHKRGMSWF